MCMGVNNQQHMARSTLASKFSNGYSDKYHDSIIREITIFAARMRCTTIAYRGVIAAAYREIYHGCNHRFSSKDLAYREICLPFCRTHMLYVYAEWQCIYMRG